jgi:two-component system nitrate/nitrite sensor histidine kinase NarX
VATEKTGKSVGNEKGEIPSCPLESSNEECNPISCLTLQHANEIETLLNIQQAITSHLDLSDVLQLIADEARRLTDAKLSFLFVLDGDELYLAALSGTDRNAEAIGYRIPVENSLAGKSIRTGKPFALTDVQENDPRLYSQALKPFGKISCYLTVPLIFKDQPIGVISVADECQGTLGDNSLRILTMLAPSASIGIENARLYKEQQERRQEAEGRHQMAESLRVMLDIVNSNRSLDEILNYIVTHVSSRLMGCQGMVILAMDPKDGTLTIKASHSLFPNKADPLTISGYETAEHVIHTRQPFVVTGFEKQERPPKDPGDLPLETIYHAWLAVPLIVKGEIYGAILNYYLEPRKFSAEEINLGLMFSDEVALAIGNARLRIEAEQSAVSAERNRLARELHDAVSQTLFSANLIAEVIPRLWEKDQANARARLNELSQLTRGALAEMRTLLFELRPAVFREAKLGDLLKHLVQAISIQSQLPIFLTVEGTGVLPPEVQIAFYRITQEALNNVIKHANASQVKVTLSYLPESVKLVIADDGQGFDPSKVSLEHFGLSIMQERAASISAEVYVHSRSGGGTQIEVIWSGSKSEGHS